MGAIQQTRHFVTEAFVVLTKRHLHRNRRGGTTVWDYPIARRVAPVRARDILGVNVTPCSTRHVIVAFVQMVGVDPEGTQEKSHNVAQRALVLFAELKECNKEFSNSTSFNWF